VVEARERSGALITADLALEEGREVFAVPGEITSALSAGTNGLLRLGATAATSAADVLETFGLDPSEEQLPALSPAAETVLARVQEAPVSADELARALGLDAGAVAAALVELDLHELLTESSGIFRGAARR
jgi:DNA processing protein